jgi:hypothetical protein
VSELNGDALIQERRLGWLKGLREVLRLKISKTVSLSMAAILNLNSIKEG